MNCWKSSSYAALKPIIFSLHSISIRTWISLLRYWWYSVSVVTTKTFFSNANVLFCFLQIDGRLTVKLAKTSTVWSWEGRWLPDPHDELRKSLSWLLQVSGTYESPRRCCLRFMLYETNWANQICISFMQHKARLAVDAKISTSCFEFRWKWLHCCVQFGLFYRVQRLWSYFREKRFWRSNKYVSRTRYLIAFL